MEMIENRTFDEIKLGDTASLVRTLSREDIDLFAIMSGDVNPAHVDEDYAKSDLFHTIIGHGMWGASLISTLSHGMRNESVAELNTVLGCGYRAE
jgi:acyl dehydratase